MSVQVERSLNDSFTTQFMKQNEIQSQVKTTSAKLNKKRPLTTMLRLASVNDTNTNNSGNNKAKCQQATEIALSTSAQKALQLRRDSLSLNFGRSISEPLGAQRSSTAIVGQFPILEVSEEKSSEVTMTISNSSPSSMSPSLHPNKRCRTVNKAAEPNNNNDFLAPSPLISSPTSAQAVSLLQAISLPNSPCAESSTLQKSLLMQKAATTTPAELASRLGLGQQDFLVVDCRPFIAYNVNHIKNAINVNCCDKFNRKRLRAGAALADLAATREGKERLRSREWTKVVVYDDCSDSLERLPVSHTLFLVMNALAEDHREPVMLLGGIRDFEHAYRSHCEDHLIQTQNGEGQKQQCRPRQSLFSQRRCYPGRLNLTNNDNSNNRENNTAVRTPTLLLPASPMGGPTNFVSNSVFEPANSAKDIENHPATRVLPHLYLGNMRDAGDAAALKRMGIRHVLNVTAKPPNYSPDPEICYKQLEAADNGVQNLKQFFEQAFEFVELAKSSGSGVLIHCHAGVSRSPTIAVAYLMKYYPMAMSEAYRFVKTRRSIISPNLNFMGQLYEYEQGLKSGREISPNFVKQELTEEMLRDLTAANNNNNNANRLSMEIPSQAGQSVRWAEHAVNEDTSSSSSNSSGCSV